jgi:putative CocE/NonD family hydrolase
MNKPNRIGRLIVGSFFVLGIAHLASAEVVTTTVEVAMRDGVKLVADVYRDSAIGPVPVVLMRTPYDRTKQKALGQRWAGAGYVFVVQDCRGSGGSQGEMAPYNNEGQDGYDTIEWVVAQPWCNGRVGMTGGSYVGAVQWQAAVEHPPGLMAIAPQATWTSFYDNLYLGGAVRLALISGWIAGNTAKPAGATPADMDKALLKLPLSDVDEAIGWPMPWLDAYLNHPQPDGFWTRLDLVPKLPELKLPVLHVVGYYDFFSRQSVDSFNLMQQGNPDDATTGNQRLILGPWDHGTIGKSKVGEIDFGPEAELDPFEAQLDWFERYLKADPAARANSFAPVRYFSMGDNQWHEAMTWPPKDAFGEPFYLLSQGKANTRGGDGRLSRDPPSEDQPADKFRADPADPTPASPVLPNRPLKAAVWGPVDQRPIEDRNDVLVYTSEPMTEPLVFAGTAKASLFVSTDTPDADWAVKLIDVHPDGFAQNIARGILRGRYRKSLEHPELMRPGEIEEILIDLGPVAATILPGHRLRVDISGADFPLYDRNPNTAEGIKGDKTAIATEQVHHRPGALSRIVLPVRK